MTTDKKEHERTVVLDVFYADDELPAREKLHHQLNLISGINIVGYATTGKEAIELINQEQPDLVFLDIQMPEIDGLDLLSLLDYKPLIIYTTAYDKYAIEAFEHASIDYLLKPYPLSRLKSAVDKARTHWLGQKQEKATIIESHLVPNMSANTPRLVSKNGERITILSADNITYFTSYKSQTFAIIEETKHNLSETLDQLEDMLDDNNYVRVHRSYMVNVNKIKEIQRWFNGKLMIIMQDKQQTEISTSRSGAEKLKQLLRF